MYQPQTDEPEVTVKRWTTRRLAAVLAVAAALLLSMTLSSASAGARTGASPSVVRGGCGTVPVPGGNASLTITDRSVSCTIALALVRAYVQRYAADFYKPGTELPDGVIIDHWDCGIDAVAFACDQGTARVVKQLVEATVSNPEPTVSASRVNPKTAASRLVAALTKYAAAHPSPATASVVAQPLCVLEDGQADVTFEEATVHLNCANILKIATSIYGKGTWTQATPSPGAADNAASCADMGTKQLTNADNLMASGANDSAATYICAALTLSSDWTPAAG